MNGWKVVPVEPDDAMYGAARDWSIQKNGLGVGNYQASGCYRAMVAAAPTPPIWLPPLPKSVKNKMRDFAVACARGGHEERVDSANALRREIEAYARSALAQYGIKEQSDE